MPRTRPAAPALDVYLLPSVIGGGLGDVAEVHSAGQWLLDAGFRVRLFRPAGHPWTRGLPGPFEWPSELRRPLRSAPRALTVSSQFGVTCAPARDEPLGRAGEWADEVRTLERAYGGENVLHLSLEEFARTLTSPQQVEEREREGGVTARRRAERRESRRRAAQVEEAHELYRKFRAFDRENLLTLFPTFTPVAGFTREFPEAIQIGPVRPYGLTPSGRRSHGGRRVLWYASPSTSDRLVPGILAGLADAGPGTYLMLRAPRGLEVPEVPGLRIQRLREARSRTWGRTWASADLAIVSGSRTLLEAIATRTPFLYYNGVAGRGARARRHRPEKLRALVRLGARGGIGAEWRRDLLDFSRARRVRWIVRDRLRSPRAARGVAWSSGFPLDRSDGARVLVDIARGFARGPPGTSREFAASWRAAARTVRGPISKD